MALTGIVQFDERAGLQETDSVYQPVSIVESDDEDSREKQTHGFDSAQSNAHVSDTTVYSHKLRFTYNFALRAGYLLLQALILFLATYGIYMAAHGFSHVGSERRCRGQQHSISPAEFAVSLPRGVCNCGETIVEARIRGCKFDPISMAWLPDICRDDELIRDFNSIGDSGDGAWLYWEDMQLDRPLTLEQVANLSETGGFVSASRKWHITHCSYMWLKLYRSLQLGYRVDVRLNSEPHIRHCYHAFLGREPLSDVLDGIGTTLQGDWRPEDGFAK